MPRAPAPNYKRRKEPILDHLWVASIQQANGKYDEQGHYAELIFRDRENPMTKQRAEEIKRALYRARKYVMGGISGYAKVEKDGDGYIVRFKAIDKTLAKKYMIEHWGPDRTRWPYSPWRHDPNFDQNIYQEEEEAALCMLAQNAAWAMMNPSSLKTRQRKPSNRPWKLMSESLRLKPTRKSRSLRFRLVLLKILWKRGCLNLKGNCAECGKSSTASFRQHPNRNLSQRRSVSP